MDLDDARVGELFPDDREERTIDDVGDFYLGIDNDSRAHVLLYTDKEEFTLTEGQLEEMMDELHLDSVWGCIANRFKVVEYLHEHDI